jgi:hypothetical protein
MCMMINPNVASLNKRVVWKVFDRQEGKIVSLYKAATYPKGKRIKRDAGIVNDHGYGEHGLHFFVTKARAIKEARDFPNTYVAKFKVSPKDFLYAGYDSEVMYERATRVGNFIKVK